MGPVPRNTCDALDALIGFSFTINYLICHMLLINSRTVLFLPVARSLKILHVPSQMTQHWALNK